VDTDGEHGAPSSSVRRRRLPDYCGDDVALIYALHTLRDPDGHPRAIFYHDDDGETYGMRERHNAPPAEASERRVRQCSSPSPAPLRQLLEARLGADGQ
jgi:hypothetical protein